jgi:hypothetical protein
MKSILQITSLRLSRIHYLKRSSNIPISACVKRASLVTVVSTSVTQSPEVLHRLFILIVQSVLFAQLDEIAQMLAPFAPARGAEGYYVSERNATVTANALAW